jgi:hypothetical protein
MTVLITLTTAGSSTGSFSLYSNVDSYSTPFETGVAKSSLLAGYTSSLVPTGTTIIRVMSTGTCTNYTDITIVPCTTTTTTSSTSSTTTTTTSTSSTTTTTTTALPYQIYTITSGAYGDSGSACSGTATVTVYALPANNTPIVGMIFYDSPSLTTPFVGSVGWRKLVKGGTTYAAEVDSSGELTNYITCP